jgi:hypothetical protein
MRDATWCRIAKAKFKVWVRGYGLVDSPKVDGEPGTHLNLTAVKAPNDAAAAQYYPAIYWYAMLRIPDQNQFGGKSDVPEKVTQAEWLTTIKNQACIGVINSDSSQPVPFGSIGTSGPAKMLDALRQSGQAAELMVNPLAGQLGRAVQYFVTGLIGGQRRTPGD